MSTKYLLLWFEAPLQAWGYDSKFSSRQTNDFPTKSGIYGIYLSALGLKGEQKQILKELSGFNQTIFAFSKDLGTPTLVDYHMVGSGYNKEDKWESFLIPRKEDGSFAVAANGYGGSKITYRHYLQNAFFAVIQELNEDLCNRITKALLNPTFDIYLGRKNCVPTDFVFRGSFDSFEEAKENADRIAFEDKGLKLNFSVSETEFDDDSEKIVLNDVPICFGEIKLYKERVVYVTSGKPKE